MSRKHTTQYAPDMHVHSTFSLLDGFGSPRAIVERACELGWGAAALSDHGWLGGAPAFYEACRAKTWWKGSGHPEGSRKPVIKPILGNEMYVVPDESLGVREKDERQSSRHLTVLALTAEGYHNLVRWSTLSMQPENFYYKPRISVEAMIESAPYGLHHNVILSGCMGGELCQCLANLNGSAISAGTAYIESMKSVFPNFYIELQHHRHEKFLGRGFERYEEITAEQDAVRAQLLLLAKRTNTKTVLTNDSHYQKADQRKAHIAMLGSKLNRWTKEEAQGKGLDPVLGYAYWTNFLQSMEAIEERTPGAQGSCQNVLDIVAEADIRLDPLDSFSYSIPDAGYTDSMAEIRRRIKPRMKTLVGRHGEVARERIEHELAAMGDFADYLLMMSDFIIHARKEGILTNTRGSAANSLLCHALKIHDIDSIEYKLTFERFVNPERKKLPDIDVDIQYDRYEDFMQYVKQYVGEREGEGNLALLCNYGMFANRSTFRTVAESLGMPQEKIDEIADLLPQMIDSGLVDEEEDVYAALKEAYPEIYDLAAGVFDNMKSVGQHACGWIFGTKDRPLEDWIPRYLIASSGQLVTQYDYKSALLFGFNKGDFLRLKMLKVVADTLKMIGRDPLDIEAIPLDDPDTFEMIRAGRTEGIFTLQGKTNRQGGIEVEPENEHGVIASVAIYRPSLTRPGYHKVYNARRRGEEEVVYPHPIAEEVLGSSYGLPIFQEQILDLGYAVGFGHNQVQEMLDAIKMAKGVGRGAAEAFEKIHPEFVDSAMENAGMTREEAEGTWDLVGGFQGYGFNCHSGDTVVLRAGANEHARPEITLQQLYDIWYGPNTPTRKKYRRQGLRLLAHRDGAVVPDRCMGITCNGEQRVFRMTLVNGTTVKATPNHRFLTEGGWKKLSTLAPGDRVVVDSGEIAPWHAPTGYGMSWTGKTPLRAMASDGHMRPILHGNDAALRAVTLELPDECEECGATEAVLERAHLNHDRSDNSRENVRMLCSSCHKKWDYATGRRKGRWSRGRLTKLVEVEKIEFWRVEKVYDIAMEGDDHSFLANGVVSHNCGHATSYGRFAVRAAYLKCHHPQEYFVSLLDTYPEKHKYVAGAKAEGFKLVTPDINRSTAGFSRGDDDTSIRVGLARIKGIGPKALQSIMAGQPFSSIDDLKARTPSNAVKVPVINSLAAVGAFQSFGIKPTDDDTEMFKTLGFLLDRPRAMAGIKPTHVSARTSNKGWRHKGLYRGVDMTEGKASVSKLFWIPEVDKKLLQEQASSWARVKTWLLLAVDENGIPYHIMANSDKTVEVEYLKFIANKHKNSVLCLEGMIRKPFDTDGPIGFRFFDVAGTHQEEPQVWVEYDGKWENDQEDKLIKVFSMLHRRKMMARRSAA